MRVRLHNNGRFPDVLSGIPRHIVRKARPWLWNNYERRVMKAAQAMSWQSRRLVRNILIAERARTLLEKAQQPKRAGWLARRRAEWRQRAATRERLDGLLPTYNATIQVPSSREADPMVRPSTGHSRQRTGTSVRPRDLGPVNAAIAHVPSPVPPVERPLIEDVLSRASPVAEQPLVPRALDQGLLLMRDPEPRIEAGGLARAAPGETLSLVERMLAGTALDSVRAMPVADRSLPDIQQTREEAPGRSR